MSGADDNTDQAPSGAAERASTSKELPFASWLMASKVAPINQPAFLIPRRSLELFQTACQVKTLTLLEAPGGYGKSTLLAQWREALIARGHIVGWLFLDEDDNRPTILLTYIIFALTRAGLPVTDALRELLADLPNQSTKNAVGMLLNILAETEVRVVLILDDFEVLEEPVIDQVIGTLVRMAPPNFHILIATRKRPRLGQSQLHAQGRLQEVRASQLRFSPSEIEQIFHRQLSKTDISRVGEVTQGWPVALQLLRSWINQDPDRVAEIVAIAGLTEEIVEYLSEQVVQTFPDPVRILLTETAVLQQLSAQDVLEVCGSASDWAALINCEPLRPFLLPHQGSEGLYRLHPILREFLLLDLTRTAPARKLELHHKAAAWYARTGRLLAAIRQAEQSGDIQLEAQIIEAAGGVQIWLRHGVEITRSINRLLTPAILRECPRLALLRALVLLKEGQLADARSLFHQVRESTADFTQDRPDGDAVALRSDALMVEATLMANEFRALDDEFLESYDKVLDALPRKGEFYIGHVKTLLCLSHHQRGNLDKARIYGREAVDHYSRAQVVHGTVFVHLHLGVIAFAQGRPEAAAASYAEAKAITQRHFSSDRSKPLLIHPLMAELHFERNELTAARYHAANAVGRLQTTESWIDIYISACLTGASIAFIDKGIEGAMGVISRAQQDAENRGLAGLDKFLRAAEILFLARAGLTDRAADLAAAAAAPAVEPAGGKIGETTWREQEVVLLARAALGLRSGGEGSLGIELGAAASRIRRSGNIRSFIRIAALQAAALYGSGERDRAFEVLADVLSCCQETGYTRIFHDEQDMLRDVVGDFVRLQDQTGAKAMLRAYASRLLKDLTDLPGQPPVSTLTPRELTVIGQLKEGYQDKMIARILNMTENTVKYHLKSIYFKLQVSSRTEAVREAHRRALIS